VALLIEIAFAAPACTDRCGRNEGLVLSGENAMGDGASLL
jgi:hypothetical protein